MTSVSKKSRALFVFFVSFLLLVSLTALSADNHYKKPIEVKVIKDGNIIQVTTGLTQYWFSKEGGNIRSIYLKFSSYGTKKAELVNSTTTDKKTLTRSYLQNPSFPGSLKINGKWDKKLTYEASYPKGKKYDRLTLTMTGERNGITIEKKYIIYNDPNYSLGFRLNITNNSNKTFSLTKGNKLLLGRKGNRDNSGDTKYLKEGKVKYIFDGDVSNSILKRTSYNRFGGTGFIGSDLVLFLKQGGAGKSFGNQTGIFPSFSNRELGVEFTKKKITPGNSMNYNLSFYAGRRRHVPLTKMGLEKIDPIGFFSKLLVPVINFLNQLYHWTGNYGWAIILFTLLIRVLLYPLMRNMYRSMAKMQDLQPRLQEIRDKYEDDKEKQQEAMMELYQEEGVNPMGGCLPMFIQLPILILLWRAILYSSEAIHLSPGFMWLQDLSVHDPYYILVVLTVGTMIIQQQLVQSPGGGGGQNKMIGLIFPLFMGVMLHNFPAGLWLYYFLTTLFQVGQQTYINMEMEEEGESEEKTPQEEAA